MTRPQLSVIRVVLLATVTGLVAACGGGSAAQGTAAIAPGQTVPQITDPVVENEVTRLLGEITAAPHEVVRSPDASVELLYLNAALPAGVDAGAVRITSRLPLETGVTVDGDPPLAAYRLEPEGLKFERPAIVRLTAEVRADGALPELFLLSQGEVTRLSPQALELQAERQTITVSAPLSHFSELVRVDGAFRVRLLNISESSKQFARDVLPSIEDQEVGVPFDIEVEVTLEKPLSTLVYDGRRVDWRVLEWTLEGNWLARPPLSPNEVSAAPPPTKVEARSFRVRQIFTCLAEHILASAIYFPTITYMTEETTTDLKTREVESRTGQGQAFPWLYQNGFDCRKQGTVFRTPTPTPAPTSTPPPAPTTLPGFFFPGSVTITAPGDQIIGQPFQIDAMFSMDFSVRTTDLEGDDYREGGVLVGTYHHRARSQVSRWSINGSWYGAYAVEPTIVSDSPPETNPATETFLVRQTFTCTDITNGTDGRVVYYATISYDQETLWTNVKTGRELPNVGGKQHKTQSFNLTTTFRCLDRPAAQGPQQISSTFDSDLEGWKPRTSGCVAMEYNGGGGNPGGFLFVDNNDQIVCRLLAPEKFRGPARDLSAYYGGTISFDGKMFDALDPTWDGRQSTGGEGYNYGTVTISGDTGTIQADFVIVPREPKPNEQPWTGWQSHSVTIVAGEGIVGGGLWTDLSGKNPVTEAQIRAVLKAVAYIDLNVEAIFGREKQGIDNFALAGP